MARTEAQAMLRVARRDLRAARLLAVDEADEAKQGQAAACEDEQPH